ncbi:MAG: conjugal transfer protein, partial [Angustibacter sp.]
MTRQNNRRAQPGRVSTETILLWFSMGLLFFVVVIMNIAVRWGQSLADLPRQSFGFWEMLPRAIDGDLAWPIESTLVAIAAVVLSAILGLLGRFLWSRSGGKKSRVDQAAQYLGRGKDIAALSAKSAQKTAERLGVTVGIGVPIGRTVSTDSPLYGSWEDMHIDIWGPRTGKTTSRAIPAILAAPGAV